MPQQPQPERRRDGTYPDLSGFVAATVQSLQRRYLANEATARGQVAALRSAAAHEPGEDPSTWDLTQPPMEHEIHTDQPTREEWAVHTALTMYAVHQQSGSNPVHVEGVGVGQAAARLIGTGEQESSAARRRFNTLATSSTFPELRRHLRSFVSQLRAEGVPLDYVSLYRDLCDFQRPGGPARVRRRWARSLYIRPATSPSAGGQSEATDATDATDASTPSTTATNQEA